MLEVIAIIIVSLLTLSFFVLAFLALYRNPNSKINRIFAFTSILIGSWNFVSFNVDQNLSLSLSSILLRFDFALGALIGASLLLFSLNFPRANKIFGFSLDKLVILSSLAPFILSFTDLGLTNIRHEGGFIQYDNGLLGEFLEIYLALTMIFAISNLLVKYRKLTGMERLQAKYVLFGITLTIVTAIITNIALPQLLTTPPIITRLGIFGTSFMVGFTAYSILKHRLLDIRFVVARAVAYSLLLFIIGLAYVFTAIISSSVLLERVTSVEQLALNTALTLIVAFTFQPLKSVLEGLTDRIFFKGRYDSQGLLSSLSNIMATTLGIRPLIAGTLNRLVVEMRITRGAIVVFEKNKIQLQQAYNYNEEPKFKFNEIVELHDGRIVVFDELEEGHKKDLLRKYNLSIAVPLEVGQERMGYLLLGEKASGEIYTTQDIDVLEVFSPELAIAIENSKSYEEIKEFNITLGEEVKRATEDLVKANNRLKELDQAKDEFVSVVSHELRTPMTAVKSYVWLVLNGKAGPLNPKVQEYLNKVYSSSERLISLINDVLDVSHIETGRLNVDLQPASPIKIAEEVIDTLKAKAAETKIDLIVKKDEAVPLIAADITKLGEIYTNLIGNALKFTPSGGKVTVSFQKNGDSIEISVADTGIGMSKEDVTKLFTKFGRLQKSYATMSSSGGSGLGLYISKSYVELMHGKIWVNSEPGKGTTFTFSLPISKSQTPVEEGTSLTPKGITRFK